MTRVQKISVGCTLALIALTWVNPQWPLEQGLHGSLTVVALVLLWWYVRRNEITDRDFLLVCCFLVAHSVAARWIYSYVPYEVWVQSIFGFSLNESFGWTRNNFDRLIHFLYGFCFTPFIARHVQLRYRVNSWHSFILAVGIILVTGVFYEWFEWFVAIALSPEAAESYNGQQGDMWDPHKDMLIALVGSVLWFKAYWRI